MGRYLLSMPANLKQQLKEIAKKRGLFPQRTNIVHSFRMAEKEVTRSDNQIKSGADRKRNNNIQPVQNDRYPV